MIYRNFVIIFVALFFGSISSSYAAVAGCVFYNSQEVAPSWICDALVEGVEVSAVGSSEASDLGAGVADAVNSARIQLVQRMKVQTENTLRQFAARNNIPPEKLDNIIPSVTKQITVGSLSGTRLFGAVQSKGGTIFVLIGLDVASMQKIFQAAVSTSKANNPEVWR